MKKLCRKLKSFLSWLNFKNKEILTIQHFLVGASGSRVLKTKDLICMLIKEQDIDNRCLNFVGHNCCNYDFTLPIKCKHIERGNEIHE